MTPPVLDERPAEAGGCCVAEPAGALTDVGAPTTPEPMPPSKQAVDRAQENYDARRTNSKVRLPPELKQLLDMLAKADRTTAAAKVAGYIEADMRKRGGVWLKRLETTLARKEAAETERRVKAALNRKS